MFFILKSFSNLSHLPHIATIKSSCQQKSENKITAIWACYLLLNRFICCDATHFLLLLLFSLFWMLRYLLPVDCRLLAGPGAIVRLSDRLFVVLLSVVCWFCNCWFYFMPFMQMKFKRIRPKQQQQQTHHQPHNIWT